MEWNGAGVAVVVATPRMSNTTPSAMNTASTANAMALPTFPRISAEAKVKTMDMTRLVTTICMIQRTFVFFIVI
jgi:hypothetical protein